MFQNETQYNRAAYDALNHVFFHTVKKRSIPRRLIFFLLGSAMLYYVIRQTVVLAPPDLTRRLPLLLFVSFLCTLLYAVAFFSARITANISYRTRNKAVQRIRFIFDGEKMTADTGVGITQFPYDTFYGVYETQDYYILLLTRQTGEIIDKKGFVKGKAANFPAFLMEKLGMEEIPKLYV